MSSLQTILRALTRNALKPISAETLRARRRFLSSMPGEIGLSTAARLYGVGR